MNLIQAIILSIVEGITEFLPVSSTGHMILASKLLGVVNSEFTKSFEVVVQLGAILAVVTLYFAMVKKNPGIIKPVIWAFLPTGIIGLVLYKVVKTYLLGNDMIVVIMLALVGLGLILLERYWKKSPPLTNKTITTLSLKELLLIGSVQALSIIPGTSRAAVTIVGGMFMGLSRQDAVEFSFLLSVPTIAAASGLELVKNIHVFTSGNMLTILVSLVVSWITALITIKAFLGFVKKSTFTGFGVYRIIVAVLFLLAFG
jgi:undecaprenyl-diphosphatase